MVKGPRPTGLTPNMMRLLLGGGRLEVRRGRRPGKAVCRQALSLSGADEIVIYGRIFYA